MSPRAKITLVTAVAVLAAGCQTTSPSTSDGSPPTMSIDFYDLPLQPDASEVENPHSYRFPPLRLRAQIGHRYGVVARLSDPQSGVRFFSIQEGKGYAECWVPGSTTQRHKLMVPREPGGTHSNGERPPSPTPPDLPVDRIVNFTVDTYVDESCAAGDEVRWDIVLVYAGTNGAGMPPRDLILTSYGDWDAMTTLRIKHPEA
jgi:hypothetical protein